MPARGDMHAELIEVHANEPVRFDGRFIAHAIVDGK